MRLLFLVLLMLFAVPAGAAEPAAEPIVIGQSYRFPSSALNMERVVNVWTPPSYSKGAQRYPVLYLIDGGLEQDFHHISGLAQLGALSWLTQEMIVVGLETVDRRRELAFPVERDQALRNKFPKAGESARFRRHLMNEVKPFIEKSYRTSGEDALIGESLAGLFIVETFLEAPTSFDTYVAMDPSLWWDDGQLVARSPALLARHGPEKARLWLSVGKETLEQPRHIEALTAALRSRPTASLDFRYEPRPGLTHATIYHPTAWEALRALYPRPDE